MPKLVLTGELLDQILFAMENQEQPSVFDLQAPGVVPIAGLKVNPEDSDRYLPLPAWSGQDGFALMARFTDQLRHPLVTETLRRILDSGQGIFKRFKATIKEYPLIYRQWLEFKRRHLETKVEAWLEEWEEYWDLTSRAVLEDEPAPPVEEDFEIVENSDLEVTHLARFDRQAFADLLPGEAGEALRQWYRRHGAEVRPEDKVLWALGPDGPVGVVWARTWSRLQPVTTEILLWYVTADFRGMGIGSALLARLTARLGGGAGRLVLELPAQSPVSPRGLEAEGLAPLASVYFRNLARSFS